MLFETFKNEMIDMIKKKIDEKGIPYFLDVQDVVKDGQKKTGLTFFRASDIDKDMRTGMVFYAENIFESESFGALEDQKGIDKLLDEVTEHLLDRTVNADMIKTNDPFTIIADYCRTHRDWPLCLDVDCVSGDPESEVFKKNYVLPSVIPGVVPLIAFKLPTEVLEQMGIPNADKNSYYQIKLDEDNVKLFGIKEEVEFIYEEFCKDCCADRSNPELPDIWSLS